MKILSSSDHIDRPNYISYGTQNAAYTFEHIGVLLYIHMAIPPPAPRHIMPTTRDLVPFVTRFSFDRR